ncbi:RNA-binding domain-containing protein [Lichtheimia hyalospora FSU 10163]|nr:RNA-binding domain-containing protein [Lichtheimia hyalospora FSU 10163]
MTDKLPPNLLKLFAPRPPLPYAPPLDKEPGKRTGARVTGIADYLPMLKNYDPDYVPWKTLEEKRKERAENKKKQADERLEAAIATYDPEKDEKVQGNPFNTLFIGRLSYDLQEDDLMREFEQYGPVKHLRLVRTADGKSRGYAFVEYEREKDMRAAYKDADGLKMLGRRILVDVERGRTVKGWKPRRLGGGLGNVRNGAPEKPAAPERYSSSYSNDRRDRGYNSGGSRYDGSYRGYGGGGGGSRGYGGGRYGDDRRRPRMRSRSPRGYRDRYGGRGRDRSRDRSRRY